MKITARNPKDFWSGVLFFAIGAGALIVARNYPFGSTGNMGPGFFPMILGGLLALLGLFIAVRGLAFSRTVEHLPPMKLRPLAVVLGAVALFGVLLIPLGVVASSVLLVILSRLAAADFRPREVIVAAILLTAFSVAVFVWGLKMPMPLWPMFLRG